MSSPEALTWTADDAKLLLQNPVKLFLQEDRWRTWVFNRGGLTSVYDQIVKLDFSVSEKEALDIIIAAPGLDADQYADELSIDRATFYRHRKALAKKLASYLNAGALDIIEPVPVPSESSFQGIAPNVPVPVHPIIGRNDLVQSVSNLLVQPDVRLLTLTGPGGIGKTRLALQLAHQLHATFKDGVIFVQLASVRDPGLVISAIAQAVGISEGGSQPLIEQLKSYFINKQVLLILDNFEQLIPASAMIGELIAYTPQLHILVTSREALRIYGEQEYPVPALALPDIQAVRSIEELAAFSSVALFVQRASSFNQKFRLTEENASAVAEICTRLDGLPLAIELITARIKYLTPQALLDRLQNHSSLALLTGGPRDSSTRQQTLRAAISWSYDLLSSKEQRLFTRIAVFENGYLAEAAETVCDSMGDILLDVFDGLIALTDKSLLQCQHDFQGNTRFSILETIREFALEQLVASGERELLMRDRAAYYFSMVDKIEAVGGMQEIDWLNRLELEHDNVRQSLSWFIQCGDSESALTMCSNLWDFWYTRGYFREGRQWLAEAFKGGDPISDDTTAKARYADGILAFALRLYDSAISSFEVARLIWEEKENKQGLARIYHSMGLIHMNRNELDEAMGLFGKARSICYEVNHLRGVVSALQNMGIISFQKNRYDDARDNLQNALSIAKKEEFVLGIVMALVALGATEYWQKNYTDAIKYYKESLQINQQLNDQAALIASIESLGLVAYDTDRFQMAAILFSAGARLHETIGRPAIDSPPYRAQQQKIRAAEAQFGEQWVAWWTEGTTLRMEEVIQHVYTHL